MQACEAPGAARRPAVAPKEVFILRDVMVAMRDGVRLATDIYLPADPSMLSQPLPVILERTPYGKTADSRSEIDAAGDAPLTRAQVAAYFVGHGYAVIYQDCRGRYGSEGAFVKYISDGEDGADTCAWIIAQPWSNGRIGTKGLSYAAHTQAALGSLGAPGVVAMFLDSGGFSNAYQGGIRQGGAFELKQVTWAIHRAMESPAILADAAALRQLTQLDIRAWFSRIHDWRPGDSPLALAPEYEAYLFEQWRRGEFDDYWRQPGLYALGYHQRFPQAATVHMSSWFDPYARTACENYNGLRAAGKGPCALILGPWTHGDRSRSWAGDVDFGSAATLDGNLAHNYLSLRLAWFERYLKKANAVSGARAQDSVELFIMGGGSGLKNAAGRMDHGGRWRRESHWPPARTALRRFYLHASGPLSETMAADMDGQRRYAYDPRDPVPTMGGAVTSGEPLMRGGGYDQHLLRGRADVLVFESAPLADDLEVTGAITACLWIASDGVDTDFTVKLIDVYPPNADYPNGYEMILTDGIVRARYRDSWEHPSLLTPGEVVQVTIAANPVSNVFKTGHRIRVDISSSNFPKYDSNPNTGAPEGPGGATRVAINTVYCGGDYPSCVLLPVIDPP